MKIQFLPISTSAATQLRNGKNDAYGRRAEHQPASDGTGTPCRHCLSQVPKGEAYLIAAFRPFDGLNPYTETGPIFLCARDCKPAGRNFPAAMLNSPSYIVRGYDSDERIVYGTGGVVPTETIAERCEKILAAPEIAFVHIRSASNNCFHCRVERV